MFIGYGDPSRGVDLGYETLMNNWENSGVHLTYHGLMLAHENTSDVVPQSDEVRENTVVVLGSEGQSDRKFRIEARELRAFSSERVAPASDTAAVLLGKKVGDTLQFRSGVAAPVWTILSVKHVWLDALHRSIDEFNERFPKADGLQRFGFDPNADDPLEGMREYTKAAAEASERVLEIYTNNVMPLSFIAALLGKDPIEAWSGLPSVGTDFRVCAGAHDERNAAIRLLEEAGPKGCVLDAVTLSIVRLLSLGEVVATICGPLMTTNSVLELLQFRLNDAREGRTREQGSAAFVDGDIRFFEYTQEMRDQKYEDRKAEYEWCVEHCDVAAATPSKDLSESQRSIADRLPSYVMDPALAAEGSGALLISEDMGYRAWAHDALSVGTSWLQPILMIARSRQILSEDAYFAAINKLVFWGHSYISIEPGCLIQHLVEYDFEVEQGFEKLVRVLGGRSADFRHNIAIAGRFLVKLERAGIDLLGLKKVTSAVLRALCRERFDDRNRIIGYFVSQLKIDQREEIIEFIGGWLKWNSMGWKAVT